MALPARHVPPARGTSMRTAGRPPARSQRPATGRLPFVLLSLVVVGLLVTALASAQALVNESSFQLEDLSRKAERLEARYGQLRLELAERSAPDRMVGAARRAGLVRAGRIEVLEVPRRVPAAPPADPSGRGVLAHAPTAP